MPRIRNKISRSNQIEPRGSLRNRRPFIEPLEDRRMLSVTQLIDPAVISHAGSQAASITTLADQSHLHAALDTFSSAMQGVIQPVANSITANPAANSPPLAHDDFVTINENTAVTGSLLANDGDSDGTLDPTTVAIVTSPIHGLVTVNPTTGFITYTPGLDYAGPDSFTYTVKDNLGAVSNLGTVSLTINAQPVPVNDSATTDVNTPVVVDVLANDSDPDGTIDPTSVILLSAASHGTTSISPTTGAITYTPALNYAGPDSFGYYMRDNLGAFSHGATVSIIVGGVTNSPPVAHDDVVTLNENTVVTGSVLSNDGDLDGTLDPTTVAIVTSPSHGLVTVNPTTGFITYTPGLDYAGPDSFTYTVKDNLGAVSNLGTVSLTINAQPVAVNDSATTNVNTPVVVDVLANDSDPDGTIDPTSVLLLSAASHGTTSISPTTGAITYTPALNYAGPDSFGYYMRDNLGAFSHGATVSIIVGGVTNSPPVAHDDVVTLNENTVVTGSLLANDGDLDGTLDPTTVAIVTSPSHGLVTVNPTTGFITYTPGLDYAGPDSFTYTVKDNLGAVSNLGTVSLTINAQPVAVNDSATTTVNTPVVVNVLANDSDSDGTIDPTSVLLLSAASHGTTSISPTTGAITYTPALNYVGPDSFGYYMRDNLGAFSHGATVSITVNAADAPPVAANDSATTNKNAAVAVNVLANDSDSDGTLDPTTVAIVGAAGHGSTSVNPTTGVITYAPASNYTGPDSFTYKVKDNSGANSNTATVSITVNAPLNTPPVAVNDSATTNKNVAVVVNVLSNDSDSDGSLDPTTVAIVATAGHGSTSVNPTTGAITYTPASNYVGSDSFTYKVKDNSGANSNTATVSITVNGSAGSGAITGAAYFDSTGNGLTLFDPLAPGVSIYLDTNNSGSWNSGEPTMTTLADGTYAFSGLATGTYNVREVVPTGDVRTAPALVDHHTVSLAAGQTSSGNNFANAALGNTSTLTNVVYLINGTTAVSDLHGNTHEGDTLEVSFTVLPGTAPHRYTLVAYRSAVPTYDPAYNSQQQIFDIDADTFGPGTYFLRVAIPHSYYQVDFVSGPSIANLGPGTSNINYVAQNRLFSTDTGGTKPSFGYGVSLAGWVYLDANNNGAIDGGERRLAGVRVTASGIFETQTVVTDIYGEYTFDNLTPDTYTITETQPSEFADGKDTLGNKWGTASNDKFSNIQLIPGASATGYNFGEQQTSGPEFAGNQTQTIAYWNGSNGQALTKALNGGQTATNLGNWLATNLSNLLGANAGAANNLAGKTNAQVAAYYQAIYSNVAKKAETEAMALALAVYVTNSTLAGTTATSYGFAVSAAGLGSATTNVGTNGVAFGVADYADLRVAELLSRINIRAHNGVAWDSNGDGSLSAAETLLRNQATSFIDAINNT